MRAYDSWSGRFDRPDPLGLAAVKLGDPGSWNRFAYVQGDPVNYNDPGGTNRQSLCYFGSILGPEGFLGAVQVMACDEMGGGGAGSAPDPAKETPTLGGPATSKQQKAFGSAAESVIDKLKKNKPCASLFGDNGLAKFESATFTYAVAFGDGTAVPDPDKIATTEVKNGVPTGNVTINMIGSFFGSSLSAALSDTQFRAFVLLHELGHLTQSLGDDRESAGEAGQTAADAFNKSIFEKCFGLKVQ